MTHLTEISNHKMGDKHILLDSKLWGDYAYFLTLPCPISSSPFIASVFVPRFGLDRYMHNTLKKSSSYVDEHIWRVSRIE